MVVAFGVAACPLRHYCRASAFTQKLPTAAEDGVPASSVATGSDGTKIGVWENGTIGAKGDVEVLFQKVSE